MIETKRTLTIPDEDRNRSQMRKQISSRKARNLHVSKKNLTKKRRKVEMRRTNERPMFEEEQRESPLELIDD